MMKTECSEITFAHSPDSDDAFMFYGIACGATKVANTKIVQVMKDIQTLNEEAQKGLYDVTAISFAAYPKIKDKYLLLTCGASFGKDYGPVVISRKTDQSQVNVLQDMVVAIPGYMTTAYLLLRLFYPQVKVKVIPFQEIIPAVKNGQADAGLIIHEGQLTYAEADLIKIVDLAKWWQDKTSLPMPLGGNVIKRDLGAERLVTIGRAVKNSIVYALANRQAALNYALEFSRGMPEELVDRYVTMYVNELSVDFGQAGRKAIETLFRLGQEAGFIENDFSPEFVSLD